MFRIHHFFNIFLCNFYNNDGTLPIYFADFLKMKENPSTKVFLLAYIYDILFTVLMPITNK